jgi:hypothetical protein
MKTINLQETPIRETQKKYGQSALGAAIFIAFLAILAGYKSIGKGLVLGSIFSILNFILMTQWMPINSVLEKGKSTFLALISVLIRYALLAAPLILSVKLDQFNLPATIVGIFMIQFIILGEHAFRRLTLTSEKAKSRNLTHE